MTTADERRRARRLKVDYPTVVEGLAALELPLPAGLAAVYERVHPAEEVVGKQSAFVLRDLSTNGAFLEGPALPLLSRLKFAFSLDGYGEVSVVGWTLWRRRASCGITTATGPVEMPPGVGILFESMDLTARLEIARRAAASGS